MGTDIHSIAQVQVDGKWRTVAVGIGGDPRSYNMFAMLADVRNGYGFAGIKTSDPFPVIHERRGLPSDLALNEDGDSLTIKSEDLLLSWDYGGKRCDLTSGRRSCYLGEDDNRMRMGDHSHSWCLLSELEFFVEQVASKHQSTLYGIIDRAEYDAAKKEGRPFKDWCGDVYGPNVVKATEAEYAIKPDGITHVSAEWKESALECSRLGSIMEALREVAAVCNVPHDSVRYVYGFDS